MSPIRLIQRLWWFVGVLSASLSFFPSALSGQELQELVQRCGGPSGTFQIYCHRAGLSLEGARAGVGTAATLGSETAGSASTFGHRLRRSPRIALSGRVGMTRSTMVGIPEGYGSTGGTSEETLYVPTIHFVGTVGVLNGFSPSPTVGGVLSLDLMGSSHGLFPSKDLGFPKGLWAWGLGARLGILRESFTLPGITLSAARRWMGSTTIGELDGSNPAEAAFDLEVTSFRGTIGKDFLGVGLLAGMGWDRLGGEASLRARVSPTGPETLANASDLSSKRLVYFLGGSMTFLIAQVSGEIGLSDPRNQALTSEPDGRCFPSGRVVFGSLAFRVTF